MATASEEGTNDLDKEANGQGGACGDILLAYSPSRSGKIPTLRDRVERFQCGRKRTEYDTHPGVRG